jgi:hypothetical protein
MSRKSYIRGFFTQQTTSTIMLQKQGYFQIQVLFDSTHAFLQKDINSIPHQRM